MNRIKQLRNEKNITQEVLGKLLGLEIAGISKLETGRVPLKDDYIIKLANFFDVSTDYLLGKSDTRKEQLHSNISSKLFNIPILGRVPAGDPILVDENIEGYLPIDPSMYGITSPDGFFFLRVAGESMNKLVKNGSYVLVRKQETAEDGDVIVAIVNGDDEATLKRFKQLNNDFIALEPDSSNENFKPIIINLKDTNFKVIGKVIGDFKKW
jgi:repressor LexA